MSTTPNKWKPCVFVSDATQAPEALATYTEGRNTYLIKDDFKHVRVCLAAQSAKELADKLNLENRKPDPKLDTVLDLPSGSFPSQEDIAADLVQYTKDGRVETVGSAAPRKPRRHSGPMDFDR